MIHSNSCIDWAHQNRAKLETREQKWRVSGIFAHTRLGLLVYLHFLRLDFYICSLLLFYIFIGTLQSVLIRRYWNGHCALNFSDFSQPCIHLHPLCAFRWHNIRPFKAYIIIVVSFFLENCPRKEIGSVGHDRVKWKYIRMIWNFIGFVVNLCMNSF